MTNPQSRRQEPIECIHPALEETIDQLIDQKIKDHEIRVAIISASVGIPLLILNAYAILVLFGRSC